MIGQRCNRCDRPAERTLAAEALCIPCAESILRPIRERVGREIRPEGFNGVGVELTPRPDWGVGFFDLECDECSATWVGRAGDACGWCDRRHEVMVAEQVEMLHRPDLPDVGDPFRPSAVTAWSERLARAVHAGLIDEPTAQSAYEREVRRAA